jgi:hypothetical protein
MRVFTTEAWGNAMFSLYSATVGAFQWVRFDNAVLQTTPASTALGTECIEPAVIPPPAGGAVRAEVAGGGQRTDVAAGLPPSREAALDLTNASNAIVGFQSRLPHGRGPAEVQVSLDGTTWVTVAIIPESEDWVPIWIDLGAWTGRRVHLRFTLENQIGPVWEIRGLVLQTVR